MSARIGGRERLQFDLVIRPQQIARHLDLIDAHGDLECVADDILGKVERRIENMVTGNPADLRAVASRRALFADGVVGEGVEEFGAEGTWRLADNAETHAGDSS